MFLFSNQELCFRFHGRVVMQDYITMDGWLSFLLVVLDYGFSMGVDLIFNAITAGFIKRCHGSFPSSLEVCSVFWVIGIRLLVNSLVSR